MMYVSNGRVPLVVTLVCRLCIPCTGSLKILGFFAMQRCVAKSSSSAVSDDPQGDAGSPPNARSTPFISLEYARYDSSACHQRGVRLVLTETAREVQSTCALQCEIPAARRYI